MADKHYVYRPILDLIGYTEGTDKGDGYDETLAYGAYTGGDVNLRGMTLAEIDRLQTKMLQHPKNRWNSSAIGRYQIVRTTLRKIKKELGVADTVKFDEDFQDRAARYLLWGRGIDKYITGKWSKEKVLLELSKEWASIPTPEGKGYYGGQHAAVKPSRVYEILEVVKHRAHNFNEADSAERDEYDVPKTEKKEESTGWKALKAIFGIRS